MAFVDDVAYGDLAFMAPEGLATPTSLEASPTTTAHVILTRFNVRYTENPQVRSIGTDPQWLAARFSLFERYCLPSVLAQTQPGFSWIVFFDRATPEPFGERARALASLRPGIFPIFCDTLPLRVVQETIRQSISQPPDWLLTTRLDNDDAIHPRFLETIRAAQRFERAEVLNCAEGLILQGRRAYLRRDRSNPFISLSEPFSGFKSVFSILRHVYASESYPLRQVASSPLWLQVIHDSNISNRVRGRRVPISRAVSEFKALLSPEGEWSQETFAQVLAENLTLYPLRSLRDFGITSVRRTAKLFGVDLRRKAVQPTKTASPPTA